MKKKILSIILALTMVLSVIPFAGIPAFAEDVVAVLGDNNGQHNFETFSAAMEYLNEEASGECALRLAKDTEPCDLSLVNELLEIVVLDLNGYVLDCSDGWNENYTNMIIDDTTFPGEGKVIGNIGAYGSLQINGGIFDGKIDGVAIQINGGKFKYYEDFDPNDYAIGDITFVLNEDTGYYEISVPHTHKDATGADVTFEAVNDLTALKALFANGGSGYLAKDIEADGVLTVAKDVNLCLNGNVLNLKQKGNICVNSGVTFNLYDEGDTKRYYDKADSGLWTLKTSGESDYFTTGGVITGGKATNGGCINNSGTVNMYGGNIVGNQTTSTDSNHCGAGVYLSGGEFTMNGGTICGNAICYFGGGVFVGGATFTLNKGTISYNNADQQGGGVYTNSSNSLFVMNGGTLLKNTTRTGNGTAIMCCGRFIMNGGEIKGHKDSTIHLLSDNGEAVFGGTAVVSDNEKCNVSANRDWGKSTIKVGDGITGKKPEAGMNIGLTYSTGKDGELVVKGASKDDLQYFFSDKADYRPVYVNTADGGIIKLVSTAATPIAAPKAITGLTYDGTTKTGVAAGEYYEITNNTATDAGTYTAIATFKDGYVWEDEDFDGTIEWTIAKADAKVKANNAEKVCGEADPEFTATVTGTYGDDKLAYTFERAEGTDAGTYAITPKGEAVQGNYNVTYEPGTLTIKSKDAALFEIIKKHLEENTTEVGGLMGRQGLVTDNVVSQTKGRTIIGLTEEQLNDVENNLIIVGSDGNKQVEVSVDCVYTYFYNGTTKVEAKGLTDGNGGNIVAFAIIDNNGSGEDITGYGYYRVYADSLDNFMFDTLYAAPEKK